MGLTRRSSSGQVEVAEHQSASAILAPPPGYTGPEDAQRWLASPFMALLKHRLTQASMRVLLESEAESLTSERGCVLVSFNRTSRSLNSFAGIPRERRILSLWEPPSVAPQLYSQRNRSWFGTRVAFSQTWASLAAAHPYIWPQMSLRAARLVDNGSRRSRAVSVVSNKRSANPESLYRLRRQVLVGGSARGLVDVYGRGWNSSSYELKAALRSVASTLRAGKIPSPASAFGAPWGRIPAWCGTVDSTVDTMRLYEVAVVIENEPTYVSEKLFDALAAGCVPVYVGPPLGEYRIPEHLAVQVPPNAAAILGAVEALLRSDLTGRRALIRTYLDGPEVESWLPERIAGEFSALIYLTAQIPPLGAK